MKISVVTPSFNQLEWLKLNILSVADQVLAQPKDTSVELNRSLCVEQIIQDGGSDGLPAFSEEICRILSDRYGVERVKQSNCEVLKLQADSRYSLVLVQEPDESMYDAINLGLRRSSGEVCAWLNSDEQYLPQTLAFVAKEFSSRPNMDVLLGDAVLIDNRMEPIVYRRIMKPSIMHTRLCHLHSLSCAMWFKRSAVPEPPLEARWKIIGDAILMDSFISSGKTIRACGKALSLYSFTGKNLSADTPGIELKARLKELGGPSPIFTPFVKWAHRLRRLLSGAYFPRRVVLRFYSKSDHKSSERCKKTRRLWWFWPKQE